MRGVSDRNLVYPASRTSDIYVRAIISAMQVSSMSDYMRPTFAGLPAECIEAPTAAITFVPMWNVPTPNVSFYHSVHTQTICAMWILLALIGRLYIQSFALCSFECVSQGAIARRIPFTTLSSWLRVRVFFLSFLSCTVIYIWLEFDSISVCMRAACVISCTICGLTNCRTGICDHSRGYGANEFNCNWAEKWILKKRKKKRYTKRNEGMNVTNVCSGMEQMVFSSKMKSRTSSPIVSYR